MSSTSDLRGRLKERRDKMAEFAKNAAQPDGRYDLEKGGMKSIADFNALDAEIADLSAQVDIHDRAERNATAIKTAATAFDPLQFNGTDAAALLSIGERFIRSDAFKSFTPGRMGQSVSAYADDLMSFANVKTVMTLAAGYAPANNRTGVVVPSAQRRPMVADLIPQDPTDSTQIRYLRETTFTNNTAGVVENAVKPESALALTEVQSNVQVLATTLPVTNQQLSDVPGIRAYIDNRLSLQVMLEEERQILNGTGSGAEIQGIINLAGVLTGAAANQGDVPAAILRQLTQVRSVVGFADPSGIIMHPVDWQDIRLTTTTTGDFLWGSPAEEGIARIWGIPVIVTPAMTQNTAVLGDWRTYAHISRRMGLTIDVGYVNDDFTRNRATLRAEERLSAEWLRPTAFSLVTNV